MPIRALQNFCKWPKKIAFFRFVKILEICHIQLRSLPDGSLSKANLIHMNKGILNQTFPSNLYRQNIWMDKVLTFRIWLRSSRWWAPWTCPRAPGPLVWPSAWPRSGRPSLYRLTARCPPPWADNSSLIGLISSRAFCYFPWCSSRQLQFHPCH